MLFQAHYVNIEDAANIRGGTAVVLDVVRAYTTAAWAFALGAERIVLTDDVDEALSLKARIPGALGMKDSLPLPGFELSNSPVELQTHEVKGHTIVQRTTHGTVGAVAARRADRLFCAAFLNAAATARAIVETGESEAYFVITGSDGTADEDRACAEYIAALVEAFVQYPGMNAGASEAVQDRGMNAGASEAVQNRGMNAGASEAVQNRGMNAGASEAVQDRGMNAGASGLVDAEPFLQRVAHSAVAEEITRRVADGIWGVHAGDVEAAMDANRFDFVMMAREEAIGDARALVLRAYNRDSD